MTHRILFFPWGWGGAAGYTARCLALADRLAGAGDEVAFADCGATRLVREAGFPVIEQSTAPLRDPDRRRVPPYLPFADVERVFAVAAGYHRPERFRRQLDEDAAAIARYRPDAVVIDMSPTASLAARAAGLPVVALADADFVAPHANAWMPWSTVPPRALLPHPDCLPVLDEASRSLGLGPVSRAEDLLAGDVTLIPSIPELEPVGLPSAHHVGPLYWDPPAAERRLALPPARGRRRVYVTIGSGGMVGAAALQAVLDACAEQPWVVFVSTGYGFGHELSVPGNVTLGGFTGLRGPLEWADVVVSHGGYSTVVATLEHGRPSVVVPFMSEQEMNGREMVERFGAGVLLRTSRTRPDGRLEFTDRTSGPTGSPFVAAPDIRAGVRDVLADEAMTARARDLGERLRRRRDETDLVALVHKAVAAGGR
uniref:Ata5 protein n=1 Tax=Saccharothrix mutabilis subsp. capreolus TaxID=66854 RepID=Q83W14_STRMP|nr:Ata5 protein [Saccharothrix mutabilis subsp. capreolus]